MTRIPSQPNAEEGTARWTVFSATFSVASGLGGVLLSVITFPNGLAKVLAALACTLTAGLMWQAFRERVSRVMIGWLLGTGLTIVLLIFVLSDADPTAPAVAGNGEQEAGDESTAESARPSFRSEPEAPDQDTSPMPSVGMTSPPEVDQILLDELPVVDGGEDWARGDTSIAGEPYDQSLIAPYACDEVFISYNLRREWLRFTVAIGVPDDAPTGSWAEFTVEVDGSEVYNTDEALVPGDMESLDLNVEGVFRLTLKAYACENNVAAWGNPTLHR